MIDRGADVRQVEDLIAHVRARFDMGRDRLRRRGVEIRWTPRTIILFLSGSLTYRALTGAPAIDGDIIRAAVARLVPIDER